MAEKFDEYFEYRADAQRRVHAFMVSMPRLDKCSGVLTFSHQPMEGGDPTQSEHFVIPNDQLLEELHEEIGRLLASNRALRKEAERR